MATRWVACLVVLGASCGCGPAPDESPGQPQAEEALPAPQWSPLLQSRWARSCALCHVNGEAGAPRLGHVEEWQSRLAQGEDMLLKHTLEGINSMPPLGYCMACERDDFRAMIRFMSGGG